MSESADGVRENSTPRPGIGRTEPGRATSDIDGRAGQPAGPTSRPRGSGNRLSTTHTVRRLLLGREFRRLFATRLFAQWSDGIFQASLAGAVLFNPQRAADPADVAASFAILLLPYSLLAPFAGVLLDRWSRTVTMIGANIARAALVLIVAVEIFAGIDGWPFYLSALVCISINRFFLSALSAGLPHVVDERDLVTANAFTTTLGTVAGVVGGGTAIGVRAVSGVDNHGYAVVAASAAVGYLVSTFAVGHFSRMALGPDDVERRRRTTVAMVVHGMVAGGREVIRHRPTLAALTAISLHRVLFGVCTVVVLLLFRNYFPDGPYLRNGLPGVGQALATVAVGSLLAAAITPAVTRRFGKPAWVASSLILAGVSVIAFGVPCKAGLLLVAALMLGVVAQAIKICADTVVQETMHDDYRGRVFSVYDTLFNAMFVLGIVAGAFMLPADGRSPVTLLLVGIVYAVAGGTYAVAARRARFPR